MAELVDRRALVAHVQSSTLLHDGEANFGVLHARAAARERATVELELKAVAPHRSLNCRVRWCSPRKPDRTGAPASERRVLR